jgi:hypothetical protein
MPKTKEQKIGYGKGYYKPHPSILFAKLFTPKKLIITIQELVVGMYVSLEKPKS